MHMNDLNLLLLSCHSPQATFTEPMRKGWSRLIPKYSGEHPSGILVLHKTSCHQLEEVEPTQQVLRDGLSMETPRTFVLASSAALQKLHIHPICSVVIHLFLPSPASTYSTIFVQIDTMSPHDDDDEEARPSLIDSAQVLCDGLNMKNLVVASSAALAAAFHKLHIHPICPVVIHSFAQSLYK